MSLVQQYNILLVLFLPGSAKTDTECGQKLSSHLMASCVKNIPVKNY